MNTGPWTGEQETKKRIEAFLENHNRSYRDMKEPVSCCVVFRPAGQHDLSASQMHEILARLRGSQRASQSNDSEEVVSEGNLLDGSAMQAMGTETTLYARALRPEEMLVSPAMMTRQFMAERLPVSTAQTGQFGIPADQYHACILAIQPLQLLWEWAGLHGKRDLFFTSDGGSELLAEAPPHLRQRAFFHGAGGSGKTFCMNRIVLPIYQHFLPGAVIK